MTRPEFITALTRIWPKTDVELCGGASLPQIMEHAAHHAFIYGLAGPDVETLRWQLRILHETGTLNLTSGN
jgi:hypothetical protein